MKAQFLKFFSQQDWQASRELQVSHCQPPACMVIAKSSDAYFCLHVTLIFVAIVRLAAVTCHNKKASCLQMICSLMTHAHPQATQMHKNGVCCKSSLTWHVD
jgi:hypothetical protein